MMQEVSDTIPANIVISEFQKGYMLHDRLLRPSMVVVSKGPGTSEESIRRRHIKRSGGNTDGKSPFF